MYSEILISYHVDFNLLCVDKELNQCDTTHILRLPTFETSDTAPIVTPCYIQMGSFL